MRKTFPVKILIFLLGLSLIGGIAKAQLGFTEEASEPPQTIVTASSQLSISSAQAGHDYAAAVVVEIADGWHINAAKPLQDYLIPVKIQYDTIPQITPHELIYPHGEEIPLMGETMLVYSGKTVIPFRIAVSQNATPGEYTLPVRLTYQPCNNKECRGPQTIDVGLRVTVGAEGVAAHPETFGQISSTTPPKEQKANPDAQENEIQKLIEKYGFWGYFIALGLAFVTGLLLSFSPCTYPMIPITVSIFAGQERSMGRGFIMSLFYVGSMAVVYGIMGLIVASVGGVFGAWLASTPVVIAITVIFVIFSLSMFGLYELQVPLWLRMKLGGRSSNKGVGGVIVLGVVAALVVSPCVGPFVAGILLYIATSGSPVIGFLVLFVFAMGLGTLYMIIGTFSSAITALPNSGMWMESVKKFFGFVLLLMAIYFLRTIVPTSVTAIVTALILLAFGVFGGGLDRLTNESGMFLRLKKYLGILALVVGIYLLVGSLLTSGFIIPPASEWLPAGVSTGSGETEQSLINWRSDLDAALSEAAGSGHPVLIDTWATWCVNCRVLDKKTFHNPTVAEEAKRFVAVKVQLETSNSAISKDFMARFGLKYYSLPTTLLLDSTGKVRKIMQGVVEPNEMLAEMKKIS